MFGDIQTDKMTDLSSLKEMGKERQVEGEGKGEEKYIEKQHEEIILHYESGSNLELANICKIHKFSQQPLSGERAGIIQYTGISKDILLISNSKTKTGWLGLLWFCYFKSKERKEN